MVSGALRAREGNDRRTEANGRGGGARRAAAGAGQRRRGASAKRARSAVALGCDPVDGHRLDLRDVPPVLFVGEGLPPERAAVYEGLLAAGVLPIVAHRESDTSVGYLERSLCELEKRFESAPFTVALGIRSCAETPVREARGDDVAATFQVEGGVVWIDAADLDEQLRRADALAAASLFEHLGRATRRTYDAFTPGAAISGAEWIMFNGDANDWWDELRCSMREDDASAPAPTMREVRQHVRQQAIRTPGFVKRTIGSHHARLRGTFSREVRATLLPPEECLKRLARVAPAARTLAERLIDSTERLERIASALDAPMTVQDRLLLDDEEALMAQPGLVIETSRSHMVHEVLEELWQYAAQATGFGLNYGFVLRPEEASYRRFERTLALVLEASTIVEGIALAFGEFSAEQTGCNEQ